MLLSPIAVQAQEAAPAPASPSGCELHIRPTANFQAMNTTMLSGFGVVGAIADAATHADKVKSVKEQMADILTPDVQFDELKKIEAAKLLGFPADTALIVEKPFDAPDTIKGNPELKEKYKALEADEKAGKRLTTSTAACYAELQVSMVFYQKAALYGTRVFTFYWLRDYRDGKPKPKAYKGMVQHNASAFPAEHIEQLEASKAALIDAYRNDFSKWVELKYKQAS